MIHSSFLRAAALGAALTLVTGCGSSSSKKKSSSTSTAATTTNTTPTPGLPGPGATPAHPNPGGSVVAITTASTPVNAQLTTDAFVAFWVLLRERLRRRTPG